MSGASGLFKTRIFTSAYSAKVNARLIDGQTGLLLWAESFESNLSRSAIRSLQSLPAMCSPVCTENSIRVDDVTESPKLAE
jgi:hypothetical protein